MLLSVGTPYTRESLAIPFEYAQLPKTQVGIISKNGRTILFVTLDKTQQPNKDLHYNDFFQGDVFHWDSQTTQHADTPMIKSIRNGDVEVHLFVRIKAKIKNKTQPFIYCGKLQFAQFDRTSEKPVHIVFEVLDYQRNPTGELKKIYEWKPEEPSPFELPKDELLKIQRNNSKGQGFGLSGPERVALDKQAMLVAYKTLENLGANEIIDVSKNESRDYAAKFKSEEWSIEVKGTTSNVGESFFISKNEKKLHELHHGKTGLIFVTNIMLSGPPDNPIATGGTAEVYLPWQINEWEFEPITYKATKKISC